MTTTTLTEADLEPDGEPEEPERRRLRRRRWLVPILVLALLGGGLAARSWWSDEPADIRAGTTLVDADGLAARYGIRVTLIAVMAAGGLVEFRYQVVDPDKADPVRHDDDLLPAMVVEDSGETLVLNSPPHHHSDETRLGGTYFVLFPNARNALQDGTLVTLVLGDVRLEHLEVRR